MIYNPGYFQTYAYNAYTATLNVLDDCDTADEIFSFVINLKYEFGLPL